METMFGPWLPWVQAFGWTLAHFVWQGFLVGALYALVRALVPRANSHVRYVAGLAALSLMVLGAVLTFLAVRPLPATAVDAAAAGGVLLLSEAASDASLLARIEPALPWFVAAWCVGVLLMLARSLHHWRALARVAHAAAPLDRAFDAMLAMLRQRFGIVRSIRVLVSRHIDTPTLIGWVKPVILLPASVALGFPREQIELILAHELGHLRRYDHLVNLAQAVVETLFFYHPVVHWISRDIRNERELCCDALVLRLANGEPREYARTLAALEELRQLPSALALAANGGELLERVRRIVGLPPRTAGSSNASRNLLVFALIGMVALVAARGLREERVFFTTQLAPMEWVASASLPMSSLSTLGSSFSLPSLRLAHVDTPEEDAPAIATPAPAVAAEAAPADDAPRVAIASVPAPAPAPPVVDSPRISQSVAAAAATTPARLPAQPAPSVGGGDEAAPVALHTVQPRFPSGSIRGGSVTASFAIAADGSVADVRIDASDASPAFSRAAERALRQWRFDPATLPAGASPRYTQVFVFRNARAGASGSECIRQTGSQICRDPDDVSWAASYSPR